MKQACQASCDPLAGAGGAGTDHTNHQADQNGADVGCPRHAQGHGDADLQFAENIGIDGIGGDTDADEDADDDHRQRPPGESVEPVYGPNPGSCLARSDIQRRLLDTRSMVLSHGPEIPCPGRARPDA